MYVCILRHQVKYLVYCILVNDILQHTSLFYSILTYALVVTNSASDFKKHEFVFFTVR